MRGVGEGVRGEGIGGCMWLGCFGMVWFGLRAGWLLVGWVGDGKIEVSWREGGNLAEGGRVRADGRGG